jgi:putative membrane protein
MLRQAIFATVAVVGLATAQTFAADNDFVMKAAKGGIAEVQLGQMASEKATSDAVKQFAQRMVTDHGKANDELKTLAKNKNITLPDDPGAEHKSLHDKLMRLSGEAFDKAYVRAMLDDHQKDVAAFRTESKSGTDPDVKAWAAKTLPTLEEHLKMVRDINGTVGTSGTKKTPTAKK